MPKQVVKNQHYIPQSLLRHFADPKEKLFEAFLMQKKIFPTTVANTMSETYTYEYDKLPVNTIENFFSRIEGEVATGVTQIINTIEEVKGGTVEIEKVKNLVEQFLGRFLVFYYRSGALLTEFSFGNKDFKIPLLSEKILNQEYINALSDSIIKHYDFAIIESSDDFLLSDQFVSTAAIKIKTQFFDISNRHIGLRDTIIFIPISASYYVVFWNTPNSFFLKKDSLIKLESAELNLINRTIINNSYIKVVCKKKERLEEILDSFEHRSPTQIFAGGNPDGFSMGSIKKKEVFLFEEEKKVYELLEHPFFTQYKNLGRNDTCTCGSGKKFKKCHLTAYQRIQSIMNTFGRSDRENIMDFFIYGIQTIEKPIDKWSGFSKDKNQADA